MSIQAGEQFIGGFVPLDPSHGIPSHWIGYVLVDDVDAACERAGAAGGKACVPPFDVPEVGRTAVISGGKDAAGMLKKPDGQGRSAWLPYVLVARLDEQAARVPELGGTVFVPPTDLPGFGRFSVTADSTGALLALFEPTKP